MGERIRAFDWAHHPLGPAGQWPQSLKSAVSICIGSRFPIVLWWGPQLFMLYNDAYRPMLGITKHPRALGQAGKDCWPEIWHIIGPMLEGTVLGSGDATWSDDQQLLLDRNGYLEECYFTFTYSPIRDESGGVGGVFCAVIETTGRVIGERRLRLLKELAAATRGAATDVEACRRAAHVIDASPADLPFVRLYLTQGTSARLAACSGDSGDATPETLDLSALLSLARDEAPRTVVAPLAASGSDEAAGYLVAGISDRRAFDDGYRSFVNLVAGQIASAIADARALEAEHRRAEALAELDRAKTVFFSDVSHEFRTPLTLILSPLQDALRTADRALDAESLQSMHRNALRLQKLVNALLDFSRLEAGRVEASFEPTDLAKVTVDIASAFRSAMERARLGYDVSCAELPQPVYVDRGMWETIVLNLLSNAFKFTLEGSVSVTLAASADRAELIVRDTGMGIAPEHLPRLFERFYRVRETRARTFEGSGVGLALVQELVRIHGGTLTVESVPGTGTTFRVTLPFGSAHLPPDRINAPRAVASSATAATAYVEEALRWLPVETPVERRATSTAPWPAMPPGPSTARILVVDDNADMLDYVRRLLEDRWRVVTASHGVEALELARREAPDLVITDVMMPVMDGFALLRALRADDRLKTTPVIVLTAKAGEEARLEALRASADDHLAKPFSARELVMRVDAMLSRSYIRRMEQAHRERLLETFQQAPVAIAVLRGPEHVYDFVNEPYEQLIGRRDMVGKPIRLALPELHGQGIFELLDDVYASGQPYTAETMRVTIHRGPAGAAEEGFFKVALQPARDLGGTVTGIVVVAIEVTELAIARGEAEAANRAKDEFLAMLGHELRNPLAPILTALQLMRLRNVGAERERAIIERQVQHVVHLVDDLLDISRITRGKVQLRRQCVALATVVAKAIEMASPMLEQRAHTLTIDVPRDGCEVNGDPARLAQVFANLFTNAAKYTDPGGHVTVSARVDAGDVVLSVRDTGIGIAPEALPGVFDLFTQSRQPIDRSEGGLGLGLAIVKSLVALHGGRVTARSEGLGRGAEFEVRLPRAVEAPPLATAEEPRAEPPGHGHAWRVLIVDDNEDAAAMLASAFAQCGHETRTALDAPSALASAQVFEPDIALLDIGLPVVDGYELASRFREHETLRGTRLVAITGYGQEHDRRRAEAAGFDAHMVKPVDLDRLLDVVDALARDRRGLSKMNASPSS